MSYDLNVFFAVMAPVVAIVAGCVAHLYKLVWNVREYGDGQVKSRMDEISRKIEALRSEMQADRQASHESRLVVSEHLGGLVKRDELERQINRLMDEIRGQNQSHQWQQR